MAGWAAGIQAAGSIGGAGIAAISQHNANAKNIRLARENRDWEERMSNTAWQRGVNDMLKAGINPMLATSSGPASTPSNSAATVQPVDAMGKGVTSAASVGAQRLALQQQEANIALTNAQAYKEKALGNQAQFNSNMQGFQWDQEADIRKATRTNILANADLTKEQKQQLIEMLPYLKNASAWQTKLNEQLTHSAQSTARLNDLAVPEAQATADWFTKMGAAGQGVGFSSAVARAMKEVYQLIRQMESKK